jgi:hypothetical protein
VFTPVSAGTITITVTKATYLDGTASVTVNPAAPAYLASITVSPSPGPSITSGATQSFTAAPKDQYGFAFTATVTWSATGGTINSATGLFTAGSAGPYTITAINTSTGIFGTTSGTIISPPAAASIGYTGGNGNTPTITDNNQEDVEVYLTPAFSNYTVSVNGVNAPSSGASGHYERQNINLACGSNTFTIVVSRTGYTPVTTTTTIYRLCGAKLVFIGVPTSSPQSTTTSAFTVQRQDQYGVPWTIGSITVSLATSGSSPYFRSCNSGSSCTITTRPISDGSSSTSNIYYYTGTSATTRTLTASSGGYTSATDTVIVT